MRKITISFIYFTTLIGFTQTNEIDSLSIALAFETKDSLKVKTSLRIIDLLYEKQQYSKALKYLKESEKLAYDINYPFGIAKTTYLKAQLYSKKNDYINAIDAFTKAKLLFKNLRDTVNMARVDNSIGIIEIERGNHNKGLQYTLNAIQVLEQRNLHSELRKAYANLGMAYYKMNNIDKAIDYNLKALDVQEKLNDETGLTASSLNLAELYSQVKEHRKAIEFYEKVLLTKTGKTDSIQGLVLPKLGGEYLRFNDYDTAAKYLLKGLKLNRQNKNETNLAVTLNNLGQLNLKQNYLKTAESQLLEAGTMAKKVKSQKELLKNYSLMRALDSTKKDFEKAFFWQNKYYVLKDSMERSKAKLATQYVDTLENISESTSKLDLTSIKNNTSNINTDNQLVYRTDRSNIVEVKKLKMLLYVALGALTLISVFFALFYLKRNKGLKNIQELEEQHLKVQLQNEAFIEQTKHLENINNVKDKLFSIVSHDLKDSLSSINGFINLLKDGSLSRAEFDSLIPELSENANNASLLLFNLLNWSKSQMQSLKPTPSLFDVQEVIEEKVKLIEQRLESKGIELIDHSLRDFAYADKSMIEIVIQNLLANALKFSNRNDSITVSNHISNGTCIISVADTGVGIPKDKLETLFSNNTYTTMGTNNEKGTGLGLSICKELVELNNGKIWVESTINKGSTFYVQLPKSKPKL